jgi:ABC-type Mn2+/Zn2+ transport system permease subunit
MNPSFSPPSWMHSICKLRNVSDYDQAAANRYGKTIHDARIAMDVLCGLSFSITMAVGIVSKSYAGCGVSTIISSILGAIVFILYRAV